MRKGLFPLILALIFGGINAAAQVLPANGDSLHYRLIGFSVPLQPQATGYRLEIFTFNTSKAKSLSAKPILTQQEKTNKIIATVPAFGKQYVWRVLYLNGKNAIGKSETYDFVVRENPYSNKEVARVDVINAATKYKDMLVFFDNTRSLYNMQGEPVWFLPQIPSINDSSIYVVRDIKLTKDNTITFLTSKNVHEMDYYGHIIWSGPNNGKISGKIAEQYHHEITKLSNGHYMTIADKFVPSEKVGKRDTTSILPTNKGSLTPCGTLVEYNAQNDIVWTWNSCDYIKAGDLITHFNAFYFDEKNKVFYTSYRNIGRIIKAEYPSGRMLAQYGYDMNNDGSVLTGNIFSQHNCNLNSDGNLILFNNNFKMHLPTAEREKDCIPAVVVFKEPTAEGKTLLRIWEFKTDIDTFTKPMSSGGGSVRELDKGDYLVCTGLPGRNFIVSSDKKILWNVVTWQKEKGEWKPASGYRISPIRKEELPKILFK
ncbi:MAG: aryl-sulfate sulfotransferase [Chitinophagales bacterium]|nr:aryl-sulfate sulfotransferase [Chitinophagales bacterium]